MSLKKDSACMSSEIDFIEKFSKLSSKKFLRGDFPH